MTIVTMEQLAAHGVTPEMVEDRYNSHWTTAVFYKEMPFVTDGPIKLNHFVVPAFSFNGTAARGKPSPTVSLSYGPVSLAYSTTQPSDTDEQKIAALCEVIVNGAMVKDRAVVAANNVVEQAYLNLGCAKRSTSSIGRLVGGLYLNLYTGPVGAHEGRIEVENFVPVKSANDVIETWVPESVIGPLIDLVQVLETTWGKYNQGECKIYMRSKEVAGGGVVAVVVGDLAANHTQINFNQVYLLDPHTLIPCPELLSTITDFKG